MVEARAPKTYFSHGACQSKSRCADPEGGQVVWTPPPLKKHKKCRVSLQYWSGSPASSARQQNAISMAIRCRAEDGPFILVTKLSRLIALSKLSRSAHGVCFLIILYQRTCRATECDECEITHGYVKETYTIVKSCLNSEDCSLHFLRENL